MTRLLLLTLLAGPLAAEVTFEHRQLDPKFRSEGVAVADFNRDGHLDIAAGNMLYAGPDWRPMPLLGEPLEYRPENYSDAFLCFADDLTGDGWPDLVVVGYPNNTTSWWANPGAAGGPWTKHQAVPKTGGESPLWEDIDGDGRRELLFFAPEGLATAAPGDDPTRPWPQRLLSAPGEPKPGHGLGFGDLNGDDRPDICIPQGWWEAPADRTSVPWRFHKVTLTEDCAQMQIVDIDGDGDADILSTSAHRYGVWWTEQTPTGWVRHEIDRSVSQTHALHLVDLTGNGLPDLITGKRFWAHRQGDPGIDEPALLVWYETRVVDGQPSWTRHVIHEDSGVGLHFQLADVNGDGRTDVICANKKGVNLFLRR